MIIGIIIAVVVVILAFWLISAYNNFVKMKNKIACIICRIISRILSSIMRQNMLWIILMKHLTVF